MWEQLQQRTTEMTKGLKHLTYKERLSWDFTLEKKRVRGISSICIIT